MTGSHRPVLPRGRSLVQQGRCPSRPRSPTARAPPGAGGGSQSRPGWSWMARRPMRDKGSDRCYRSVVPRRGGRPAKKTVGR
eukprot:11040550-Alexandrium_andersonii.AAC.1